MTPGAFTIDGLADYWNCSKDVIYDLLKTKELKGFRLGKAWRISAREVERFENREEEE